MFGWGGGYWAESGLAASRRREPIAATIILSVLRRPERLGIGHRMTLPAPLRETIIATGSIMTEAHDPWWIISGAAAAIYGAHPIEVSDVDVMLSVTDAERLFARVGIEQAPPSDHPRFRSEVFGQWTGCALVVEFMANFTLREMDGIWRSMRPKTRRAMRVGAVTVFVPEVCELRHMFERFGREKDHARIALLDQLEAR
jgi:hypothetical protein